jgi:hypothetical protein
MEWRDLVIDAYGRVSDMLQQALKNVTPADLNKQPRPDCNSMGWIVWHLTRGQDSQISDLSGKTQVWIEQDWHSKFNRSADPSDTGFGDSSEDVKAFKSPEAAVLLGYYNAVLAETRKYLQSLQEADLGRVLDEPYKPPPTVGVRITSVLADCLGHAGEVDYLRGLLGGKGWLGY